MSLAEKGLGVPLNGSYRRFSEASIHSDHPADRREQEHAGQAQSVKFNIWIAFEVFLVHELFPLSLPWVYFVRGKHAYRNHGFSFRGCSMPFFLTWGVPLALCMSYALHFTFRARCTDPELLQTAYYGASTDCQTIATVLYTARNLVLGIKYGMMRPGWWALFHRMPVPGRITAASFLLVWVDPPIDTVLHLLNIEGANAEGPPLPPSRHAFHFDRHDTRRAKAIRRFLFPTRPIRRLITAHAPDMVACLPRGIVPARLVALSVILQGAARHRLRVLRVATGMTTLVCAVAIWADFEFNGAAGAFRADTLLIGFAWCFAYLTYFVSTTFFLAYVLVGVVDTRRRYRALKLLDTALFPSMSVRLALSALGMSHLHHLMAASSSNTSHPSSTHSSGLASAPSDDPPDVPAAAGPSPQPVARAASGRRAHALFTDWAGGAQAAKADADAAIRYPAFLDVRVSGDDTEEEDRTSSEGADRSDPGAAEARANNSPARGGSAVDPAAGGDEWGLTADGDDARAYRASAGPGEDASADADADSDCDSGSGSGGLLDGLVVRSAADEAAAGRDAVGQRILRDLVGLPPSPRRGRSRDTAAASASSSVGICSRARAASAASASRSPLGTPVLRARATSTATARTGGRTLSGTRPAYAPAPTRVAIDSALLAAETSLRGRNRVAGGDRPQGLFERVASAAFGLSRAPSAAASLRGGGGLLPGGGGRREGGLDISALWRVDDSRDGSAGEEESPAAAEGVAEEERKSGDGTAAERAAPSRRKPVPPVPEVVLDEALFRLDMSQNAHAFLWTRQIVRGFGRGIRVRIEAYSTLSFMLAAAVVGWVALSLFSESDGGRVNRAGVITTPILLIYLCGSLAVMVRDAIKANELTMRAKYALLRQEHAARSTWREIARARQAEATRRVLAARLSGGPCPSNASPAFLSDLHPEWGSRRVCDTSAVLHCTSMWLFWDGEMRPVKLFGIRASKTLLRSLYTAALSGVSVGARYLVELAKNVDKTGQ